MKPTLLVLAAGMGSRYGGLKQLDAVGPSGETIMDYSIYDAIRAGFGKVVFVIRRDFEEDFRRQILPKYENHIPVELVFQSIDALPAGFKAPEGRTKPWGTNHAVMMAAEAIKEPFTVINADDFYGRDSFATIGRELANVEGESNYCMVGFRVGNTLSESGTVARGVCSVSADGYLTGVVERTDIQRVDGKITFTGDNGFKVSTDDHTLVSMNMWGFTPDYFRYSEEHFSEYLSHNITNPKAEFYIPLMVNQLIVTGKARVKMLDTTSQWFGVTYAEDRAEVVAKINALVEAGEYPARLF